MLWRKGVSHLFGDNVEGWRPCVINDIESKFGKI